jgi:hypothetical protein
MKTRWQAAVAFTTIAAAAFGAFGLPSASAQVATACLSERLINRPDAWL